MKNIHVGTLPCRLTDDELRATCEAFGEVASARIIIDRDNGRSEGFGFAEMPDDSAADSAIKPLDGQDLQGHDPGQRAGPREPRR